MTFLRHRAVAVLAAPARSALAAGVVLGLLAGAASAQPAEAASPSSVNAVSGAVPAAVPAGGEPLQDPGASVAPRLPTIPVFFGDIYEGRLSADNGYNETTKGKSTFDRSGLYRFNAAAFEIELLKDESVGYGLWTDSDEIVSVFFMRQQTDRDGKVVWARMTQTSHVAKYRCIGGFRAPETGKYRIEVEGFKAGQEASYRLFILPRYPYGTCGRSLPPEVQAYFERPGKPASRAIAESWLGKAFTPRIAVPAVFGPPPTPEADAYAATRPDVLRPFYRALYMDGEHNAVLNFERLGLAAMQLGLYADAEWAFDEALSRIEAVYGRNAVAEAARSKWVKEGIKDFKGEPYERAMAYYYRGLLYLRAGDYENARSSFVAGEFQDTLSEAEQFQGDFALLNFLSGWSSHCLGDTAAADEAFAIAQKVDPAIRRPAANENTLVIADIGQGPVKMARGRLHRLLTFVAPLDAGRDEHAVAAVSGRPPRVLQEYGNLAFQAGTRGGRAIDAVLDGKAALKGGLSTTAAVAEVFTQSGVLPLQAVGFAVALATRVTAGQVKPDADVRMWDTLPHRVSVDLAKASPSASFDFSFKSDVASVAEVPVMRAHHGRCGIAWTRTRSAVDVPAGAPGNDADIVKARAKNNEAVARDEAFRAALVGLPSS